MPTALGDKPMNFETHARPKNRWGPFLGDTSETTYEVLDSKLPYISE
jgi:hypothetical protein